MVFEVYTRHFRKRWIGRSSRSRQKYQLERELNGARQALVSLICPYCWLLILVWAARSSQ